MVAILLAALGCDPPPDPLDSASRVDAMPCDATRVTVACADVTLLGESAPGHVGDSVSGAGDVDGDGFDDVIIGAPMEGDYERGAAYLVLGGQDLSDRGLVAADARFAADIGRIGSGVAGVGDVDGDGFDDLIVGAPLDPADGDGYLDPGVVYLVPGAAAPRSADLRDGIHYTGLVNDRIGAHGMAMAGAGDVNGDGFADLLLGASLAETEDVEGGAYLVLGSAVPTSSSLASAQAWYPGPEGNHFAGGSVSGVGDVDGDGLADVAIGSAGDAWNHRVSLAFLVLGRGAPGDTALADADAVIQGDGPGALSVAGAGDVDADGLSDVLIGAPGSGDGGMAILLLGSGSLRGGTLPADADAQYLGGALDLGAGGRVAGVGDIDADGFGDLLIGTHASGTEALDGAAYLVLGGPNPLGVALASADRIVVLPPDLDGGQLAGVGDVDGDGADDLAIGAPYRDDAVGAAFLFFGRQR